MACWLLLGRPAGWLRLRLAIKKPTNSAATPPPIKGNSFGHVRTAAHFATHLLSVSE
jgi:hypothetical protein